MSEEDFSISLTDSLGESFEFDSPQKLLDFLSDEEEFWNEQAESLDPSAENRAQLHGTFKVGAQLRQLLDQTKDVANRWESCSASQKRGHIQSLQRFAENLRRSEWNWRDHAENSHLIKLQKGHGQQAVSAFKRVVRGEHPDLGNIASFYGSLTAYEFVNQASDLVSRRKGEKIAIGRLKRQLREQKTDLSADFHAFREEFQRWNAEGKKRIDRRLRAARRLLKLKNRQYDAIFTEKIEGWSSRIEELETAYAEKLRLEKPADYWRQAARKYRIQGGIWAFALAAVLGSGLYGGGAFFFAWLQGQAIGIALDTVQGVTVFGALAATYAYFVRVLSKLVFSSYHLMRDAEEREQLTYLYLSLTKDAEIGTESRDIVLQALFSRSDPGLLSGDSGPTLPTLPNAVRSFTGSNS